MRLNLTMAAAVTLSILAPLSLGHVASASEGGTAPDVTTFEVLSPYTGVLGRSGFQTVVKGKNLGEYEETFVDAEFIVDGASLGYRRIQQTGTTSDSWSTEWDPQVDGLGEFTIGGLRLTYTPEGATEPVTIEDTVDTEPFFVRAASVLRAKFKRAPGARKITVSGRWMAWDFEARDFVLPVAGGSFVVDQFFGDPDPYPDGSQPGYRFKTIGAVQVGPDGRFKEAVKADPKPSYWRVRAEATPTVAAASDDKIKYNNDPKSSPGRI